MLKDQGILTDSGMEFGSLVTGRYNLDPPIEGVNLFFLINLGNLVFPMTGVPTEVLFCLRIDPDLGIQTSLLVLLFTILS